MTATAITFQVLTDPRPAARPKVMNRRGKGGKMFPVAIKADEDVEAQADVGKAFTEALGVYGATWPQEPDRAYQVHLIFGRGNYRRADADNLTKTVLDGLTGLAWKDDSQAVRGTWAIDYTPRRENGQPFTLVTIRRLPYTWKGEPMPLVTPQPDEGSPLPLSP